MRWPAIVCPMLALTLVACGKAPAPDAELPAPRPAITTTISTVPQAICHDGDGHPIHTDPASAESLPPGWCP